MMNGQAQLDRKPKRRSLLLLILLLVMLVLGGSGIYLCRVQEQSNRAKERNNLRLISVVCLLYASEHGGKIPTKVTDLTT